MSATTQTTEEPEAITGGNTLDVRDIIARVKWLRNEMQSATDTVGEAYDHDLLSPSETKEEVIAAYLDREMHEERDELVKLESLLSDLVGSGGDEQWEGQWDPMQLIADDYFEDYAQELAEETTPGCRNGAVEWPFSCIDWEKAARELKQDYSMVEFDGETYWYR